MQGLVMELFEVRMALERIASALEKLAEEPKEEKGPRIDGFGTR